MTPTFAAKLCLTSEPTNVGSQKIDSSTLEIYGITTAGFSPQNSLEKVRFSEKTFLLAYTSMEMILGMFFLKLINTDIKFPAGKLT